MGMENLGDLIAEIRKARDDLGGMLDGRDGRFTKRFEAIEADLNKLFLNSRRPGSDIRIDDGDEHKDATALCILKHDLAVPKVDPSQPDYIPSPDEVQTASTARRGIKQLFRTGNYDRLDPGYRKSMTSFTFGSNAFIMPPQLSDRVLSCLVDPTDVAGLMGQATTSGASLKFLIDNVRMQDAAWACDVSCFANNPQPDLSEGLGELEIKAETLRFIVCANNDLLADSSFNIENWILNKASDAFRRTISNAVISGDGIGKPLGILHPSAGIQVCDTSAATPVDQFTWQDLVMLAMEIPAQWQAGASYFMNQRTLGLLLTMSDAIGRPLFGQLPGGMPGFQFAGWPIHIVTQMPNAAPGTTPVAFGNWQQAYTVLNRRATTMVTDPYSAGFCTLFKFDARIGGSPTCPNAAKLLRIA